LGGGPLGPKDSPASVMVSIEEALSEAARASHATRGA
jgi:hypothetical protein